ncbi:minor capsid protein [Novosphingobium olei]|uniref:minor capsid protein n=1 Tax=Novosphingobium olei TaxID=2728851 RepID=UPI0030924F63|nr:phage Mu protein gp30-like [Novosphingobium olei]
MRYDLAQLARRGKKVRRESVTLKPITAPGTLATDLYAAAYAPVVKAWDKALPDLMAVYSRALATMTQDSPEEVGGTLNGIEAELTRLLFSIRLRIEQWALKVEKWQRTKWVANVKAATGVELGTLVGAGDMRAPVSTAIERNVSLVKSVSEQSRARIGDAVFRGLQQNRAADEVAKEIREAVDMSRRRARNVASDQLVKLSSQMNAERRREAGIDTWEWVSSHKVHFRPEHAARDGKRYADGDAPGDLPGELPFCGCTERAVLSLDGEF